MSRMIQNTVAVNKVAKLVEKMTTLIEKQGADQYQINDSSYSLGYLKGMLTTLCCKNPQVLDHVIDTIDYLEEA